MNDFWNFFERMNEVVYVTDMDTNELVYMNERARKAHHVPSLESLKGQLCYQVLQGCSEPCPICTNARLRPGEFYEWKYYNPLVQRTFALKDTMIVKDGRRYRLELAIDISVQEQQRRAIEDFTANEALLNEGLRLALSAPAPEQSLQVLMQYLGQSLSSERVYIFEETPEHTFDNTYEWCAHGSVPQKEFLQNVPYETVEVWYQSFLKNENVLIRDLESIREENPRAYEILKPQNIHSLVASPLVFQKKIIGFYGVDNPPANILNHISVIFDVLGHFIVSILRRRDLVRRLETLSYYDQLTGALNRHKMNESITEIHPHESIGILYCDVLGLKKINDTKGHLAGDDLLIRSCNCLLEHFPKDSVYRIGGDEFMVMISNIPEDIFLQKVDALRKSMPRCDLSMSLGCVWRPRCNGRINELISEADGLMYEEKRLYYEKNPRV